MFFYWNIIVFFFGMVLVTASYMMLWTSIHSSSGILSDLIPWIYLSLLLYDHKGFDLGHTSMALWGFPDSSVGKESTCNARDPSSIPVSGRSPGERTGYPLQYSWASLVAQLVKNLSAMQETWVRSMGWEDSLEKGKATHSRILAWRIPWTARPMGSQRARHTWVTFIFTLQQCIVKT